MKNPILIALYNHKGGVSKTTTTFNLGWTFANMGIKTLIVDLDPQCNLTDFSLGLKDNKKVKEFYEKKENEDIHSILEPVVTGKDLQINPVKTCDTLNENLKLIAGNFDMSDIELQISISLVGSEFMNFTKQFVGSLNAIIRRTAEVNQCELVLIDMSPSSGAMNRSILMSSDYFLIPASPDFFSYRAIQKIGDMLYSWNEFFKKFRDPSLTNPLPKTPPKMLGVISQKFRPYTPKPKKIKDKMISFIGIKGVEEKEQEAAKRFQEWIDKIQKESDETLAKKLKPENMVVDRNSFMSHVEELPYNLISIGDFNSLIAISQENQKPVFSLSEEEIKRSGYSLEETQKNQEKFKELFKKLATRIQKLIQDDRSKDQPLKSK